MRREDQLPVAAAFFRAFVADDASGVDIGLTNRLMEEIAQAGTAPDAVQFSCAFENGARAAGRWLFHFAVATVSKDTAGFDLSRLYGRLLDAAEFPEHLRGVDALASHIDPAFVSAVSIGFDARVDPDRTRLRVGANLASGEQGRRLVQRVFDDLGIRRDTDSLPERTSELVIESGPHGLADVKLAYAVAPDAVLRDDRIRLVPLVAAMVSDARVVKFVRSLRVAGEGRLVCYYDRPEAAEGQLTAWARRSGLLAELRRQMHRANRGLPGAGTLTMQPYGMTVALARGAPDLERFAALLRLVEREAP